MLKPSVHLLIRKPSPSGKSSRTIRAHVAKKTRKQFYLYYVVANEVWFYAYRNQLFGFLIGLGLVTGIFSVHSTHPERRQIRKFENGRTGVLINLLYHGTLLENWRSNVLLRFDFRTINEIFVRPKLSGFIQKRSKMSNLSCGFS